MCVYIYIFLLWCADHITQVLNVLHDKILLVTLDITFWPFCFVLLSTRQASKSSLKNRSTCYSATAVRWCQSLLRDSSNPMRFDVLLQCEGCAGMWCSMAETGIRNFLPNLISAKPQPSRQEGSWGHESPIMLKKEKKSKHDKNAQYFCNTTSNTASLACRGLVGST